MFLGIFLAENENNNTVEFKCPAIMSSQQCQLLNATKASSVITIVWCFSSMYMLYYKWYVDSYRQSDDIHHRFYEDMDPEHKYPIKLIHKVLIWLQLIFSTLTIVLYSVFASSYYMGNDDDVNIEDDNPMNQYHFEYAFYLWIAALVFTATTLGIVAVGNKIIYFCSSKDDEKSEIQ